MSIVNSTDLKNYLSGVRLAARADEAIPIILDGTQAELETYLGYPITDPADTPPVTEQVGVDRDGHLITRQWPVAAVTSVVDAMGDPATYVFTADGQFYVPGPTFDTAGYTVVFIPGLPPHYYNLAKLTIMRVASREVKMFHDDSRINAQDANGRKPADPVIGWQKGEKRPFSKMRIRNAAYSAPRPWLPEAGPTYGQYGTYGNEVGGVVSVSTGDYETGDVRTQGG